jgi:hypothetical protein
MNISLGGKEYILTTKWNEEGIWILDISDAVTNLRLLSSLPIVCGSDLLAPFPDLGFNGGLVAYTNGDEFAPPTYTNLGVESDLYFVTV